MVTILNTLSNEEHLGVISTFVFNCNTIHGKVELKLAKSKVAIGFLIWCLRFENKYSVFQSPWLPCSGYTISSTGPSVSPFRDFFTGLCLCFLDALASLGSILESDSVSDVFEI